MYSYRCDKCDIQTDEIKKISDRDIIDYKQCEHITIDNENSCEMKRVVSEVSSPQFKGTGFYATDY